MAIMVNRVSLDKYNVVFDPYIEKLIRYQNLRQERKERKFLSFEEFSTQLVDDAKTADKFVAAMIKDLALFEAFNHSYSMKQLIGFTGAYLLDRKVTPKSGYPHYHALRQLNLIGRGRTEDVCDMIMDSVDSTTRSLLSDLIEKKTFSIYEYKGDRYENMVINIVLKLTRTALELEDDKQNM